MSDVITALALSLERKEPATLISVVSVKGASPAKVGAQIVLLPNGITVGTVGGGKLESSILEDAKKDQSLHKCDLHHYQLTEEGKDSIGTLCGGEVTVFVQPYFPPPQIVIVGGGHIGQPLKIMGEAAGFDTVVVDVAPGLSTLPELEKANLHDNSYVVLITTDHVSDEAAMRIALKSPVPYIGMIGSLAKWRIIREHLTADGLGDEDLSRIFAPIGLDLGGTSPEEIAVAILAEVVAVRHQHITDNSVAIRRA